MIRSTSRNDSDTDVFGFFNREIDAEFSNVRSQKILSIDETGRRRLFQNQRIS